MEQKNSFKEWWRVRARMGWDGLEWWPASPQTIQQLKGLFSWVKHLEEKRVGKKLTLVCCIKRCRLMHYFHRQIRKKTIYRIESCSCSLKVLDFAKKREIEAAKKKNQTHQVTLDVFSGKPNLCIFRIHLPLPSIFHIYILTLSKSIASFNIGWTENKQYYSKLKVYTKLAGRWGKRKEMIFHHIEIHPLL